MVSAVALEKRRITRMLYMRHIIGEHRCGILIESESHGCCDLRMAWLNEIGSHGLSNDHGILIGWPSTGC